MHIRFLIDNPTRDLPKAVITKIILSEVLKWDVSIKHRGMHNRVYKYNFNERIKDNVDVLVVPQYSVPRHQRFLAKAYHQGAALIIDHSEQILYDGLVDYKVNSSHHSEMNRHVSSHIVWGDEFAKHLVQRSNVDTQNIFITGNPKLDIAKRIHDLISSLNDHQNNVLFVSDFSLADQSQKDFKKFRSSRELAVDKNMNVRSMKVRSKYISFIEQFATKYQSLNFLVRPHPGEVKAPYKKLLELNNVEITGSKEFPHDVAKSQAVFQYTSTSIFEVIAMGVPVFCLDVPEVKRMAVPHEATLNWKSFDQVKAILESIVDGKSIPKDNNMSEVDKFMYEPFQNSTAKYIAALMRACEGAMSVKKRCNMVDHAKMKLYPTYPFLKDVLLRSAFCLNQMGVSNRIHTLAKEKWSENLRKGNYLSNTMLSSYKDRMSELISEEDIHDAERCVFSESEYGLHVNIKS